MNRDNVDILMNWIVDYHYTEDIDNGVGYLNGKIRIKDCGGKMDKIYNTMKRDDKDYLITSLIERIVVPCEIYNEDFYDNNSGFSYEISMKDGFICFEANFRV